MLKSLNFQYVIVGVIVLIALIIAGYKIYKSVTKPSNDCDGCSGSCEGCNVNIKPQPASKANKN